jgi:predicted RNase H-like nuclease (RuvC/YqgF family)
MNREEYEELEDQFDGLYDKWLVAKQRIKHLESGPGGIMEMKQTIADKEKRIEALEAALLSYYRYVCPTCGGRCCVVQSCPENLARAALGEKKDD